MPAAELRVLGPVEVVADDGAKSLPAKHMRLLVALVLHDGRTRDLDELAEAIWDGSPPASARKLVQFYVSQLRKALPAGIEIRTRQSAYAVELAPGALDVARFERLLDECFEARRTGNPPLALSLADRALSLWRGRAYGELAYEDFARAESERLEELRLVALEERLDAQLALARPEEALGGALALAQENPFRERVHMQAMLALYRCGRQTEALEHYAGVRTRLDEELGLEPGEALRDLQRRILQQDPALDLHSFEAEAAAPLPIPPNPLVGRERELDELRALLERRDSRLVVLTGAGGSGKTRLALEIAREVAGSYANGAALVELAPLRDPALVVPTIAQALDVAESDAEPLEALATTLAPRELLLVVDNAEHVREAASDFAELVARAPRLTLLVTSRAVLHVSGEHVFPVTPLPEDDALELFTQRARLLEPGFELTSENEAEVREVCRRLDGLPLAIELAAARIRTLTPRVLRERLGERLRLLTGGPRDLPARQQTLRETIGWSVGLLGARERRSFARLAVFPGGAALDAAETVCDADLDTLGALVDEHLIRRDDACGEPRFGLLETVREYALELLGDHAESTGLAMASYLAELAAAVEVEARTHAQALAKLDPEVDNVRAALDACAEAGDGELELRLAGCLWRYWWVRGSAKEGLDRIERALAAAVEGPSVARSQALRGAAGLAWSLGDVERAKVLGAEALQVAVAAGSMWDEGAANTLLGIVANDADDRTTARRYHERSIELAEQLGVEPTTERLNLSVVALDSGEYDEARILFERVLEARRREENAQGIGFAHLNLGVVHYALGEHEASLRNFEEARECFQEVGFRVHVAHAHQGFAAYAASEGRFEDAARLLGQARAELDEIGAPEDDFASDMIAWTKEQAGAALGAEGFEAAYAAGRETDGA